ncbi:putative LRR containing protein [Trachipleistophora hominis]|uniref:Putative LRR containing protein n=1 Tax=Trachipleistophora hominis TaxID=72359 RepID=L7JZL4_TRAHO|nr:putative LRR containing protein [Trachipleistophora hominis]
MPITFGRITHSLVKVILFFKSNKPDGESDYIILNSLSEAKLKNYIDNNQVEDIDFKKHIRWYDSRSDVLNLYEKNTDKKTGSSSQDKGNMSSNRDTSRQTTDQDSSTPTNSDNEEFVAYLEIHLPISKELYRKISEITHLNEISLSCEEIYEVVDLNLFTILDNTESIICGIVNILQCDPEMIESLTSYYCERMHALLTTFEWIDISVEEVVEFYNSPGYPSSMLDHIQQSSCRQSLPFELTLGVFHWTNCFGAFVAKVKKHIGVRLKDPMGNELFTLGNVEKSRAVILELQLESLNISYLFDHIKLDSKILMNHKQQIEEKFSLEAGCSNITLDIDFTSLVSDECIVDMREIKSTCEEILSSDLICGDHISTLILRFKALNCEIDASGIFGKKCELFFNGCSWSFIQSLNVAPKTLCLINMTLPKIIELGPELETFICDNVVMVDGQTFTTGQNLKNMQLINVKGCAVKLNEKLTVYCQEKSTIEHTIIGPDSQIVTKLVNVKCNSLHNDHGAPTFLIYGEMSNTYLKNAVPIKKPHHIFLENCRGVISLEEIQHVQQFQLSGSFNNNIRFILPPRIVEFGLINVVLQESLIISDRCDVLKLDSIEAGNNCTIKVDKVCNTIKSNNIMCGINVFDEMFLGVCGGCNNISSFTLDIIKGEGMYDLQIKKATFSIKDNNCQLIQRMSFNKVQLNDTLMINIDETVEHLLLENIAGTVVLSGKVYGTFTANYAISAAKLEIKRQEVDKTYDITIDKMAFDNMVIINCNTNKLLLNSVKMMNRNFLRINGAYNELTVNNYSGIINIVDGGFLLHEQNLTEVSFAYNKKLALVSINTWPRMSNVDLTPEIKNISINKADVVNLHAFYLRKELESVSITNSTGNFFFEKMLNLFNLKLEKTSIVMMSDMQNDKLQVALKNLKLEQSLQIDKQAEKILLEKVTMADGAAVCVTSDCKSIEIQETGCYIQWLSDTGSFHRFVCRPTVNYEFGKCSGDGNWFCALKKAHIQEHINFPPIMRSIVLSEIVGDENSAIILDETCKNLLVDQSSISINLRSPRSVEKLTVSFSIVNFIEICFLECAPMRISCLYVFEDDEQSDIKIIVDSESLKTLSFRQDRFYASQEELYATVVDELSTIKQITSESHPQRLENIYMTEDRDLNLINLLENHFRNNISDCKCFGYKCINKVEISLQYVF